MMLRAHILDSMWQPDRQEKLYEYSAWHNKACLQFAKRLQNACYLLLEIAKSLSLCSFLSFC